MSDLDASQHSAQTAPGGEVGSLGPPQPVQIDEITRKAVEDVLTSDVSV